MPEVGVQRTVPYLDLHGDNPLVLEAILGNLVDHIQKTAHLFLQLHTERRKK